MFFFFQAEDGIRDKLVTGVQTCALPISRALVPGVVADLVALLVAVAVVFERAVGVDVRAVGAVVVLLAAEVRGRALKLVAPTRLVAVGVARAVAAFERAVLLRGRGDAERRARRCERERGH